MNTKTDEGLYEKARKLFISKASIDEFAGWATPRQVDAVHRLLDTELANRERAKHDRLLRRARFPVVKGLDGYDFTNVRLPDGYMLDELLGLGFIPRAQDLDPISTYPNLSLPSGRSFSMEVLLFYRLY